MRFPSRLPQIPPQPWLTPVPTCACHLPLFFPPPSDYGFERSPSSESNTNKCSANFWFNPLSPPDDCALGQTYTSSLG